MDLLWRALKTEAADDCTKANTPNFLRQADLQFLLTENRNTRKVTNVTQRAKPLMHIRRAVKVIPFHLRPNIYHSRHYFLSSEILSLRNRDILVAVEYKNQSLKTVFTRTPSRLADTLLLLIA